MLKLTLKKRPLNNFAFNKVSKAFLYYDNISLERNLNFVMNLGHNNVSSQLKSNIGMLKLSKSYFHFLLRMNMKRLFRQLLKSLEKGKIDILNHILEPKLKMCLYRDISLFSKMNYNIKLSNQNEPIYIKLINIYELENLNTDRDLNGYYKDYNMEYKSKNRISIFKANQNNILKLKNKKDLDKEKELFYKSEFKEMALKKLKYEAEIEYNIDYVQKKLGKNTNNAKEVNHITNFLETLKKVEKDTSESGKLIYEKYKDYFIEREEFIEKKVNSTDLFEFFVLNMTDKYQSMFNSNVDKKKGFFGSIIDWFKKVWISKVLNYSKKVSADKILYIYDVEITSKMRIDILDEKGNNILDSVYNYTNQMKSVNSVVGSNSEHINYDTGIYNFKIPEVLWNIGHKEYHQRNLIRFEFEKKRRFQNVWKNPYKSMIITDIDLVMKGNKHFKFEEDI